MEELDFHYALTFYPEPVDPNFALGLGSMLRTER
jgi:hypothetical protein